MTSLSRCPLPLRFFQIVASFGIVLSTTACQSFNSEERGMGRLKADSDLKERESESYWWAPYRSTDDPMFTYGPAGSRTDEH